MGFIFFWVLLRSFLIAVRYGFMSKYRYKLVLKHKLPPEEVNYDLVMHAWVNYEPHSFERELKASFYRLSIRDD